MPSKRLEAIESLEDLGAGFTLATHDLEIRGAGELLGEEQTGQIQEIGYALYMEMLERAVKALKSGKIPKLDQPMHQGPEVELHVPALLPDDYLPDVHLRLVLYKRIAAAANVEELRELQVEMIDRFGLLPPPAKNLFRIAELKLAARALGLRKIDIGPGRRIGHLRTGHAGGAGDVDSLRAAERQHASPGRWREIALRAETRAGRAAFRSGRVVDRASLGKKAPRRSRQAAGKEVIR